IDEAVSVAQQAVDATPADYPGRLSYLENLANALSCRYQNSGAEVDIENAIEISRQVLENTADNDPDRAGRLDNMGNNLYLRYEKTKALAHVRDLEEAITLGRQAMEATPYDDPEHPDSNGDRSAGLSSLSIRLRHQYERTGAPADLEEALSVARQAVQIAPSNDVARASCFNILGNALSCRYELTEVLADLDEAVCLARQAAVDATPESHAGRARLISNLAARLAQRYETEGSRADLEEAICLTRLATEVMPNEHRDLAISFLNLGSMLGRQYQMTNARHDLDEAIHCFRQSWNVKSAFPLHRIKAVVACLKLFPLDTCMGEAINMGKGALGLLPTVKMKLLSRSDQQHVISTFAGLAAILCSLLLASDQVEDALSSLEEGRAIILSDLLDARSDLCDIERTSPDLAGRLNNLRREINSPLPENGSAAAREQRARRRRDAVRDLETCIQEIRATPGNERFMLGLTTSNMRQCAEGGSIVVVNVSTIRSDAIIITPQVVRAVQLTNLSASDAQRWLREEWNMRPSRFAESNRKYREYLAWLWKSSVKQILNEIYTLKGTHEDAHPLRVWWVGSGLASSMPFHAAGIHHRDKRSTETANHRTVSSYAPSIKTLAHARSRVKAPQTLDSLLMVTMPTTPAIEDEGEKEGAAGTFDLPGVAAEKNMLVEGAGGYVTTEHMDGPSDEGVLEALPRCSIAHFACHGVSNHIDPSQSGLLLQRQGSVSHNGADSKLIQDKLSVGRVSELNLRNARLAYLSACSTAQNKSRRLSDEVIHVVSGFQVAGFPHVVGCLWPSKDDICVLVAKRFYSQILGQASPWHDDSVASAIRHAVMEVMKDPRERGLPLKWATFVHCGP
ncbi:CHAT domain-containing protein, partial [Plectosphaerella plurivora]